MNRTSTHYTFRHTKWGSAFFNASSMQFDTLEEANEWRAKHPEDFECKERYRHHHFDANDIVCVKVTNTQELAQ